MIDMDTMRFIVEGVQSLERAQKGSMKDISAIRRMFREMADNENIENLCSAAGTFLMGLKTLAEVAEREATK